MVTPDKSGAPHNSQHKKKQKTPAQHKVSYIDLTNDDSDDEFDDDDDRDDLRRLGSLQDGHHRDEVLLFEVTTPTAPLAQQRVKVNRSSGNIYDPSKSDKSTWLGRPEVLVARKNLKEAHKGQYCNKEGMILKEIPLAVKFVFKFARPESHYTPRGGLKQHARVHHTITPDVDNLEKFYLDSFSKVVYHDDAQVVSLQAVKKYSDEPSVSVMIFLADGKQ